MTPTQLWMLRQLVHAPVPYEVFRKWDQRPLAGLYKRKLVQVEVKATVFLSATQLGWDVFKMTTHAKLRKDPTAPIFSSIRTMRAVRSITIKAV